MRNSLVWRYRTVSVLALSIGAFSSGYASDNKKEWDELSDHAFTEDNRSVSSHGFSETASARSFASHAFTQVRVSRPRELPPQSLAKRCMNLSIHTASIRQTLYLALVPND